MKSKSKVWQRHIDRQAKSGKSVKAYCAAHRISSTTFQYWKRKLRPPADEVVFEEVLCPVQIAGYCAGHIRFQSGVELRLECDDGSTFLREEDKG